MKMKRHLLGTVAIATLTGLAFLTGCTTNQPKILPALNIKPTLFANLGPSISVPDGIAYHKPSGLILMAVPNYKNWDKLGSKIVQIQKNGKITDWYKGLTLHPITKEVHPMGMEFGPDGNLYIADLQYFKNKDYASRLLRVVVKNGKPVKCETVVEGFKLANAVRWYGNDCYVSDTFFDLQLFGKRNQSGVFKISLKEMNDALAKGKPLKLLGFGYDPHIISQYTAKTTGDGETAGADGVCFDNQGRMYCGNFGDGVISRTTFDKDRNPIKTKVLIDVPSIPCCDGITCDPRTNRIYITNSKNNAVHVYDVDTNILRLLWINDDNDGSTGLLDQPCEPFLLDDQLILVNFDYGDNGGWGLKNKKDDDVNTLSVIKLPKNLITPGKLPCGCQIGACTCPPKKAKKKEQPKKK